MRRFLSIPLRHTRFTTVGGLSLSIMVMSGCGGGIGEVASFHHPDEVVDLAFIPNNNLFVSAGFDESSTRLWYTTSSQSKEDIVRDGFSVDVSSDGLIVAIGTLSGKVVLWEPVTRTVSKEVFVDGGSAISVSFSRDGSLLAVGSGPKYDPDPSKQPLTSYSIVIFDVSSGRVINAIDNLPNYAVSLYIGNDHRWLLASFADERAARFTLANGCRIWQTRESSKANLPILFGIPSIAVSSDERTFSWNSVVYDLHTMEVVCRLGRSRLGKIISSGFTNDGAILVTGESNGILSAWNTSNGSLVGSLNVSRNGAMVTSIAVSPDEQYILTGTIGRIGGFDAMAQNRPPKDEYIRLWKMSDLIGSAKGND